MCSQDEHSTQAETSKDADSPPDWQAIPLPPDHVLSHLTDAHCHPTDLRQSSEVYDNVKLGGLASMATIPEDQGTVNSLGVDRPWIAGPSGSTKRPRVVSCFGYHPWFTHRYTLSSGSPSKETHYMSIFFPSSDKPDSPRRAREKDILKALLPFLLDPIPFTTLLDGVRRDITQAREEGRLVMLGEVGLDGAARVLWPVRARHLYDEDQRTLKEDSTRDQAVWGVPDGEGSDKNEASNDKACSQVEKDYEHVPYGAGEWKKLTPFKISMEHQKAVLRAQMELAVELGVPVSLHCVAASGPIMEVLKEMRNTSGPRFTNRVNVDLHSGGGWSPEFWSQASKQLSNLYASPSIYITSRTSSAASLIRSIRQDRMLVESDTHDVTQSTRLVWAATVWIAQVKGWKIEGKDPGIWEEGWSADDLVETDEEWERRQSGCRTVGIQKGDGKRKNKGTQGKKREEAEEEVWTVRTLERNWARFMGLIEPYE